jgi:hypothetical protein
MTEFILRNYVVPGIPQSQNHGARVLAVSFAIIKEFFGVEWTTKNFMGDLQSNAVRNGFFELDVRDVSTKQERELGAFRTFHFAELLLNLQTASGFDDRVRELATGDAGKMEATFAELQVARMLRQNDLEFRFVPLQPGTKKGENYDFDVFKYAGLPIHIEAKCKLENAPFNPDSIQNSLRGARKQVPKGKPGVIFVKIPQRWVEVGRLVRSDLESLTTDFMRQTTRIVSVVYYTHFVMFQNGRLVERHICHEIENDNSMFRAIAPCLIRDSGEGDIRRNWTLLMPIIDGE